MRIVDMNWMQVETYLKGDDRCVVPIGSVEQHGYLSLGVDMILAERVSIEAAEPLGVPVFPVLSYGITPYYKDFPGTVCLRQETATAMMRDVLDSIRRAGFRRVLIVNGHGGNNPVGAFAQEWMSTNPGACVRFHNWYNAPKTWAKVKAIDPIASHASWMENFPWTRLPNVAMPQERKKMIDLDMMRMMNPAQVRGFIGDGNYGGYYQRPDEEMLAIWSVAVDETRGLIEGPWPQ
ncbi:MAG: creatininase family protein [Alphaproteobacteria bacterium]|nr:creatininase family protein [Alphaproteobacteria bacterium]